MFFETMFAATKRGIYPPALSGHALRRLADSIEHPPSEDAMSAGVSVMAGLGLTANDVLRFDERRRSPAEP